VNLPRWVSVFSALCLLPFAFLTAAGPTVDIVTPMPAPEWAKLERRILADSAPAVKAFFAKYYDERGYFQHFVRWGANDGPDDAFETPPAGRSCMRWAQATRFSSCI
jgi:hypothetical protein